MKSAPKCLGPAGGELARERLTQYLRYSELVAEQEAALESEDLDRFEELAQAVADLRGEIGLAGAFAERPGGSDSGTRDLVEILGEALAANQRIQDRLSKLRHESAGQIRTVMRRRPQARRYVAEADEAPAANLDLTL